MTIVSIHNWDKLIHCQSEYYTPQMRVVLQNIDYYMRNPWKVLKDDPASTVVLLRVDDHYLVVKRSNTRDWIHVIRRFFLHSRARKNWLNACRLQKLGIPTFQPIALLEERWGPLKWRSYFVCSYIQGIEALCFFRRPDESFEKSKTIAQSIIHLLQMLAGHWISHRDVNLSNIILVNNKPWLIDLDSMRQHHWFFLAHRAARRERERFMDNCRDTKGISPEILSYFGSLVNELNNSKNRE